MTRLLGPELSTASFPSTKVNKRPRGGGGRSSCIGTPWAAWEAKEKPARNVRAEPTRFNRDSNALLSSNALAIA